MTTIREAIAAHREKRYEDAARMYKDLLESSPRDPDVLHFFGMFLAGGGRQKDAVGYVQESLAVDPANPHAWNSLGNLKLLLKDEDGARRAYETALRIQPGLHHAWFNLGMLERRRRDFDASAAAFRRAIELSPQYEHAYESLGMLYYRMGKAADAHVTYGAWLRASPDHPVARHMYAATAPAAAAPARADDAYVRQVFDEFAESFDESLANLGYCGPQLVVSALNEQRVYQSGTARIADAGCGTGLCGPLLRSSAAQLVGIDLSEGMLEKARLRKCYDELVVGELCAELRARPGGFDAIVSADTLVYFGSLAEPTAAAAAALAPEGVFAFTVEAWPDAPADASFRITPSGRYVHAGEYVDRALAEAGLELLKREAVVTRKELGKDVPGWLVLARRP